MTNRVETYIHQSLSSAGFVILDHQFAATLRPDLWGGNGGMEASWEFGKAENMINGITGVHSFILRLKGRRDITVLARSADHLARRIEWVLGEAVSALIPEQSIAGDPMVVERPSRAQRSSTDRFAGVGTKEPGRACGDCDHFSAGHTCRKASESGIESPAAGLPRRCLSFSPLFDSLDSRKGPQLWPELVNL